MDSQKLPSREYLGAFLTRESWQLMFVGTKHMLIKSMHGRKDLAADSTIKHTFLRCLPMCAIL